MIYYCLALPTCASALMKISSFHPSQWRSVKWIDDSFEEQELQQPVPAHMQTFVGPEYMQGCFGMLLPQILVQDVTKVSPVPCRELCGGHSGQREAHLAAPQ